MYFTLLEQEKSGSHVRWSQNTDHDIILMGKNPDENDFFLKYQYILIQYKYIFFEYKFLLNKNILIEYETIFFE